MAPRVQIYYSSVSGLTKMKKDETRIQSLLSARRLDYEQIDVASDQVAKKHMVSKGGKSILPQIWVDDVYIGTCEDLDEANEQGIMMKWLGLSKI